MNTNININLDVSPSWSESTIQSTITTIVQTLKAHGVHPQATISSKQDVGPYEKYYLAISGKTRMNHVRKNLTREEQAKVFLEEANISIPADFGIENSSEDAENDSMSVDSDPFT